MTLEPLRSAMTFENVEDTSLALPSDTNLRSGQQRVLDQVHTIKRGRSKKSGSLSPTSPQNNAEVSEFRSFRFTPAKLNGTIYSRSNSIATAGFVRTGTQVQQNRTMSAKSLSRRHASSSSQWEQRFTPAGPSNGFVIPTPGALHPSRSDPELGAQVAVARAKTRGTMQARSNRASMYTVANGNGNGFFAASNSATQFIAGPVRAVRPPSALSNGEIKMATAKATKSENIVTTDGGSIPDITMKEAVEFLSSAQDSYQLRGASYIQHSTFKEDRAKQEVYQLNGIPALVSLLQSSNGQVQQTAAAALRNAVFRHAANKQEVHRCGGIADALALLPNTSSTETQKQLSGLLWNLSSADGLKPDLIKSALPVLTENIVVPFTCWSEGCASNNVDPEVFYNATGCLRNLSCAKEAERQAMRTCRGLIDSLVTYVQSCVSEDNPDDKSVENCMCILHNLTYQVEVEAPEYFSQFTAASQPPARSTAAKKSSPISCFSPKSSKLEQENVFNFPLLEDSNPKGLGWLFHSKTMQTYLSLLGSSQKDATLEACAGALQNLTANKGTVSTVMSQTIVHKLNGLPEIIPLLQSSSPSLQKTAVSLVGNLSRNPSLQKLLARQVLPQLTGILSSGTPDKADSDEYLATGCNTVHSLLKAEPDMGKKVLNYTLVNSLSDISNNGYFPKSSKAAALLLYGLWAEKDIQSFLKKQGMNKSTFVNDITTLAHKSAQVIE
ncbi:plakophilin-1 [Anguilla anguilla]|uniref:plakophilin-1 n=1 Tax=Anguilla anguilla TaxID=7936 RepID=UPI0015AE07F7|nr:plakophilin-1 [Anguilla anguilla]